MELEHGSASRFCPEHQSQPIITYCVRVNPDPRASKHIYCVQCLTQVDDSNLPKISDFLDSAATTFAQHKDQIKTTGDVPTQYLVSHTESWNHFSAHISHEKQKIETFFEDIANTVLETLKQLKEEYLETLNIQAARLHEGYAVFENKLKRFYPKEEDVAIKFPTKQDLEERLQKVGTALELEDFVKSIKQSLRSSKEEVFDSNQSDETKLKYFADYDKFFKKIDNAKPTFQEKADIQNIKDDLKKQIAQIIAREKAFSLQNEVSPDIMKPDLLSYPKSAIISSNDFKTLKEWLPENTDFNPRLLYQMSRDGQNKNTLSSQCDNQGPTVTIIKCKYEDASHNSIIGGFLDKDMNHKVDSWTKSDQAFIFSLTPPTKCSIRTGPGIKALYNHPDFVLWFGNGGTIGIKSFHECSSHIYEDNSFYRSFYEDHKIIPPESYKGPTTKTRFKIEELEVYAVN